MIIPTITEIESKLQPDFENGGYILKDDIIYNIFGMDMILPRGVHTDGLSLPWFLTIFIRKTDPRYIFWAMVHDYIYHTQYVPRLIGDAIMKAGLEAQGYKIAPKVFYYPLRLLGWYSWSQTKKKGLAKFPDAKARLHDHVCHQRQIGQAIKSIIK